MIRHVDIEAGDLKRLIKDRSITLGGNNNLKIYGKLNCRSGKRMSKKNRMFFVNAGEAIQLGFRPCGHCMRKEYIDWKRNN